MVSSYIGTTYDVSGVLFLNVGFSMYTRRPNTLRSTTVYFYTCPSLFFLQNFIVFVLDKETEGFDSKKKKEKFLNKRKDLMSLEMG